MNQKSAPIAIFKLVILSLLLPLIIFGYDKGNESPVFASKQMNISTDGKYSCHEFITSDSTSWTCAKTLEKPLSGFRLNHHQNDILFHLPKKCPLITYDSNIGINYRYTSFLQTVVLLI